MNKQNQAKQAPAQGGLSRRGFLSVAGLAAVAAGASLAGCAPQAAKEENAAVGVPETWDYECDVAVVGSGTVLTGAGTLVFCSRACRCAAWSASYRCTPFTSRVSCSTASSKPFRA